MAFAPLVALFVLAQQPLEINDSNYARYRDMILPKAAETGFEDIGWRASLWQGVLDAQKEDKPILLWAMNGHPLGCT